ncbi:MAG: hypothetical protein R3F24_08315 [Gammaproteobacteria bacterium]
MSNELMIVLAAASLAAMAGGALVAWLTVGQRVDPDPEIGRKHEQELAELRNAAGASIRACHAAEAQTLARRAELEKALGYIGTLEEQVAAYLRQYAQAKNTLKAEIRQKTHLSTELVAAVAEIGALKGRIQELEMERNAITGPVRRLRA